MLGSEAMMDVPPSQAPAQPQPQAQPQSAPQAYSDLPAEPSIRRRWLTGATDEPVAAPEPAPRVKMGGTLFERMSGRAPKAEDEGEGKAPLDIPRFLHRQNNQ